MPKITGWASWEDYRKDEALTAELPIGGGLPCALFYPADYSVGMANLGFHYIYRALREKGVSVERFFASPVPYRSVERDTMLERFPVILGAVSYETGIPAFANWLSEGGIQPSREERESSSDGFAPLIGAGGALTYINPLPLSAICDFVVMGDGVEAAGYAAGVIGRASNRGRVFDALARHPSIFVPSVHGRGRHNLKTARSDIAGDYGRGTWTTPRTVFGNTLLLELQRGCVRGCKFCVLPSCFAPVRARGLEQIERDLDAASGRCDFSRIGFVTPEAGDYKEMEGLLDTAARRGKSVSFASLRADGITEKMMKAVVAGGRRSLTIAPETGSEKLREKCGKRFSDRTVLEKLSMARDAGARAVKMYFMIGLPGETDEDVLSISELCARARRESGLRITAAVAPFVPKPGTFWAGEEFAGEHELKRKRTLLANSMGGVAGVKLSAASVKEACGEYALAWLRPGKAFFSAISGESVKYNALKGMADKRWTGSEFERLGLR